MNTPNRGTPLTAVIKEKIAASERHGVSDDGKKLSAIPFHQYMTLCLYHPEFGYYRAGTSRVGREGDFYTSAFVGDIMGEQLASELSKLAGQWFAEDADVEIVDWGGGTGRLSRQMLDAWNSEERPKTSALGKAFRLTVVEGNPEHRRLASEQLAAYVQFGQALVVEEWDRDSLGKNPAIIVANELLDAFPTHRLVQRNGKLLEWGVAVSEASGSLIHCLMKPEDPRLAAWMSEEGTTLADNQTVEVNLDAAEWVAGLAGRLTKAILVFIDYGDDSSELLAPHRMDGTLLCYYNHRAHNDPFFLPGGQDLTSHVNFSHIRRCAEASGWRELWYGSQKRFLMESGVMEKLSSHALTDPFHPTVRKNRAIRQLLLSDGMSELFKVQIFIKKE
ncbi:class I SAM-dependent methyltransferase [Cohnella luojiensis]|uniref:SAM-dependent methyltransferase n=1 Tax=Cohnella luojiensis TaxID=652876 RepID=A0A4Y8M9F7_9BACL|nr:SAM-dependent methyltransferase [Cohnella luojiensis]TFE31719.1 SAM-dependent methyltransferase [Cohnella luojiensis]